MKQNKKLLKIVFRSIFVMLVELEIFSLLFILALGVYFFIISVLAINEWSAGNTNEVWTMIFAPLITFICFSTVHATYCGIKEIIKDKINSQSAAGT